MNSICNTWLKACFPGEHEDMSRVLPGCSQIAPELGKLILNNVPIKHIVGHSPPSPRMNQPCLAITASWSAPMFFNVLAHFSQAILAVIYKLTIDEAVLHIRTQQTCYIPTRIGYTAIHPFCWYMNTNHLPLAALAVTTYYNPMIFWYPPVWATRTITSRAAPPASSAPLRFQRDQLSAHGVGPWAREIGGDICRACDGGQWLIMTAS